MRINEKVYKLINHTNYGCQMLKAYYIIGGVTPVHRVVDLLKEHSIVFDEYTARDGSQSSLTLYKNVEDFKQAKEWFDTITDVLWKTLWKQVDGFSATGVEENGAEYYDEEGRDFKQWEEESNVG